MRRAATVMIVVGLALVSCGDDAETTTTDTTAATVTTSTAGPGGTTTAPPTTNAAPTTAPRSTTAVPATLECQTVGFTPNSEDAASDVRATGLSCDEAEAFVRSAGMVTSSGGPQEVEVEGFRCVRTLVQEEPLPRSSYECTNGDRTVTFVRS